MVIWTLANLCAHSTALRDRVMSSSCFIDCIKRSTDRRNNKSDQAATWLCSNSLRSTRGDILGFNYATELVGYLLFFSDRTCDLQILFDTFNGLIFYLSIESELDKRIEQLLKMEILKFVKVHLGSTNDTAQEMILEILGQLTRYEGPLAEKLCDAHICNQVIKQAKNSSGSDRLQTVAFEIVRNMVSGTEKSRRCVIRNDREMFLSSIDALLLGDSGLRIAALDFVSTFFLVETDYRQLLNVFDSNLDVNFADQLVPVIMEMVEDCKDVTILNKVLDFLKILLNSGSIFKEEFLG